MIISIPTITSWRVWGAIPFLLLAALLPYAGSAQGFPDEEAVRRILSERVALGRNPGIVVGLLDSLGPRVVTAGVSGRDGVILDETTVFEIGSATKVFTAAVLEGMVDRGEVQFEDPVAQYLPRHVEVPREAEREITLLDLATHRSGLPRMPLNFYPEDLKNPYADYTVEEMYAFLSGYELERGIGSEWEYSNLGMGLLGHALSRKAGMSYERLVRNMILDPLDMDDTGIHLAPPAVAPFAQGHNALAEPTPNWDFPTLPGAGALKSTARDMLTFLAANLVDEEGPIFMALRRTHEVRIPDIQPGLSMALGWLVNKRFEDRPVIWHNGGTGGFHSFIGLDPMGRKGVVVLTNGTQSIDDIGFHLLDSRSPLSPPEPLGGSPEQTVGVSGDLPEDSIDGR
ncbi:MAG: serine hydrolase domain-containing protein [Gemmatimonadota bacterium]